MNLPRLAATEETDSNQESQPTPANPQQAAKPSPPPISELGTKQDYDEYSGGRPGPTLTVSNGKGLVIFPYMSFTKAIQRNDEIYIEFSVGQIILRPGAHFPLADFLESIAEMRVRRIDKTDTLAVEVKFEAIIPMEDSL